MTRGRAIIYVAYVHVFLFVFEREVFFLKITIIKITAESHWHKSRHQTGIPCCKQKSTWQVDTHIIGVTANQYFHVN